MINNSKVLDGVAVFVCVVENNSFNAAAIKLGHSSSYISKEINRLEARLGVRLLNRTTRSLSLTFEGQTYYQQCQQVLIDALQAEYSISSGQEEPQGNLKISCPVSIGLSKIRPILAQFIAAYPKINLEINLSDSKVDLIADSYDVVIRAADQLDDSSLISRKIFTASGITVVAPSYIKKHGMPVQPKELINHQTILYRNLKQPNIWQFFDHKNKLIEVPVTNRIITNSPELVLELCLAGQGIIRLPTFNLSNELETGKLVQLFTEYKSAEIGVYLVYPSRKHMPSKVKCFNDFILEHLA